MDLQPQPLLTEAKQIAYEGLANNYAATALTFIAKNAWLEKRYFESSDEGVRNDIFTETVQGALTHRSEGIKPDTISPVYHGPQIAKITEHLVDVARLRATNSNPFEKPNVAQRILMERIEVRLDTLRACGGEDVIGAIKTAVPIMEAVMETIAHEYEPRQTPSHLPRA